MLNYVTSYIKWTCTFKCKVTGCASRYRFHCNTTFRSYNYLLAQAFHFFFEFVFSGPGTTTQQNLKEFEILFRDPKIIELSFDVCVCAYILYRVSNYRALVYEYIWVILRITVNWKDFFVFLFLSIFYNFLMKFVCKYDRHTVHNIVHYLSARGRN